MTHLTRPDPKAPWIVERDPKLKENVADELAGELERAKGGHGPEKIRVSIELGPDPVNPEDEGDGA